MTVRILRFVGFVLIAFGCGSQVSAEWFFGLLNGSARETKRRQCWPEPFTGTDRHSARSPFAAMVANGWERQNLLGDFHFEPVSGKLTEAGKNKVRWIFLSAPPQHRVAYVHVAEDKAETDARMASVRELVVQIAPHDSGSILTSTIPDEGWPAEEVGRIARKYIESTPKPRLPEASTASGPGASTGTN